MNKRRVFWSVLLSLLVFTVIVPHLFGSRVAAGLVRPAQDASPGGANRPAEKDVRFPQVAGRSVVTPRATTPAQAKALRALQTTAGARVEVRYNVLTGTPRSLFSHNGYLSAPSAAEPDTIARDFLTRWRELFRFSNADLQNLKIKSRSFIPDLGTTVIVYEQRLHDVPYFNGQVLVNINRAGRVMFAGSDSFPQLQVTNKVAITAADAVSSAARELGATDFRPASLGTAKVLAAYGDVQAEYLEGERFDGGGLFSDDIVVTRTIFPMGDTGREAYRLELTTPQYQGIVWENIVDAQTGEVLQRFSLTMFQQRNGKMSRSKQQGPNFGEPGGGPIDSRRSTFRPDLQDLVESFNAPGTAQGRVFDTQPTALSGRRTCTGNPPGTNCTATTGTSFVAYGRSPAPGTPPSYAPESSTDRNLGRGFRKSFVRARVEAPFSDPANPALPLFGVIYNVPFGQVTRGLPDALNPSPSSPFGWFYLPTNTGGTEINVADDNRDTTRAFGYNMAAEAKTRNVPENSPVPATKDQPFAASLTTLGTPATLLDGRMLAQVFESHYTEGNNVVVADDRQNDNETTKGIRGYDPTHNFIATRFQFVNSYEYGGVDAVGTGPGGGPCPPVGVGGTCNVTFPATSNPDVYPDTMTLFYYNNIMHDYLYSIGFTEALFNFQQDNFGKGGTGKDAVIAQVMDGSGTDNANMSPTAEGAQPRMQMYLFTEKNFRRTDGSLDFDIVAHEQFHAVNNRAVGKGATGCVGNGLVGESGGQGEGWGDYIACSMTDDDAEAEYATGEFDIGIRRLPYTNYRWSYQSVNGNGLTRRDQQPPDPDPGSIPFEVHDTGELWAATLWDMRELLIFKQPNGIFFDGTRRLGTGTTFFIGSRQVQSIDTNHPITYRPAFNTNDPATIIADQHIVRPQMIAQEGRNGATATAVRAGARLADTLMLRGMQLSPCNPTFVDSRDSILLADKELTGGENRAVIWRAFASHGVGQNAVSSSDPAGVGDRVVEDFNVPAGVAACEQQGPLPAPTYSLSNVTPNVVTITINGGVPVAGAARYIISRATSAAGPFVAIADIPATQTTYNDDNGGQLLNLGQTYFYQVRAARDPEENCVSTANTQSITIIIGIPITPAPVFLGATQVLDPKVCNTLVVNWNPAVSANPNADIVYDVYRSTQASDTAADFPVGNSTGAPTFAPTAANRIAQGLRSTAFIDTTPDAPNPSLKLNRVYYYIVQARDQNNGKLDTNNTGNRNARFNAPTAPGVTATPLFAAENFETTAADTRFTPPLTESGNDPKAEQANFQRVTGVQIGANVSTSMMYAPDFNPGDPAANCSSTGGGQSDFYTQTGPHTLTPTSIMDWDQLFISEATFDGGLVELKLGVPFTNADNTPYPDNITTFDLGRYMVEGYYNGRLDCNGNPTDPQCTVVPRARRAFTGDRPLLHHVRIPLEAFAPGGVNNPQSLPVFIRFRMTSDVLSVPACNAGWFIDNLVINNLDQATCPGTIIPIQPGSLIISEFRLRGAQGANDEFIELYNTTSAALIVGSGGSATSANNKDRLAPADVPPGAVGLALAAPNSSGTLSVRAVVPSGTVIPARGHLLIANNGTGGYSLKDYGGTDQATADITYTEDIPDDTGVALFRTADPTGLTPENRLDAAGFATADALYREGAGLAPVGTQNGDYSFTRKQATTGLSADTDNNTADFAFVATNAGLFNGVQATLGAPGPENTQSPIQRNATIKASLIDPQCSGQSTDPTSACARIRQPMSPGGPPQGTLTFRRKFTNRTGQSVTRLRFRIVDVTTLNSPGYTPGGSQSDLRALSSTDIMVTPTSGGSQLVRGTTVEEPPTQALGGGLNTTLSVDAITLGSPLAPNASVNVQFVLGVYQGGSFRFFINVEALP